ncbi:MAG: short-chain dehydrogenase [Cyanobacteriota bacterium]|nr:short-chain dehydrogenase [Cyanobacteriota bacterium]
MSEPPLQQGAGCPPCVGITGASGSLGRALLLAWHRRGARLIAFTSSEEPLQLADAQGRPIPLRQASWQVGGEASLAPWLKEVDVLVLNHGVNVHGRRDAVATALSLDVNALSGWRLLELFAELHADRDPQRPHPEVWVNTSEAEIEPAFSPLYEISKRLMGQLLSLRALDLNRQVRIRRLVLGPFRSALNPIGVMGAEFVADQILLQAGLGLNLIIVTPNPLVYVLMPLTTLGRWLYARLLTGD